MQEERENAIWEYLGGESSLKKPLFTYLLELKVDALRKERECPLRRLPAHVRAIYFPAEGSNFFYHQYMHEPPNRKLESFQSWLNQVPDLDKARNLFRFFEVAAQVLAPTDIDGCFTKVLQRQTKPLFSKLIDTCPIEDVVDFLITFIETSQLEPSLLYATGPGQAPAAISLQQRLNLFIRIVLSISCRWRPLRLFKHCLEGLGISMRFLALWFFVAAEVSYPRGLVRKLLRSMPTKRCANTQALTKEAEKTLLAAYHQFIYRRWEDMNEWQIYINDSHCLLFGPLHFAMKERFSDRVFPRSPYKQMFCDWYREEAVATRNITGEWEAYAPKTSRHRRGKRPTKLVIG